MNKKDLNNWLMFHELHQLARLGFNKSKIARYLLMDVRTVAKYLQMTEEDYENFLLEASQRDKILAPYQIFVKDRLTQFQDTSTAQIHDWLKEHYPDFPEVSPRTVYNFVMFVRQEYNIPVVKVCREYFPVEELPYGEQSQVDFGEYNMRLSDGKRIKVRFFVMVLSRSRMKYVCFWDKPYTAKMVCQAHEMAFAYYQGIPKIIVYDQDRTLIVDENIGDILLTHVFKQYTRSRGFKLHFCRKSDPESKGKIENVVQYVKKNFLYNRLYSDLNDLNTEALCWLGRTANHLVHNLTKKAPENEYQIERSHLKPFTPLAIEIEETKPYHVKKTNVIAYKSNFYSVPMGTYKGDGTRVLVKENDNRIHIYTLEHELIGTHRLTTLTGQTIVNTNHRRDTSMSIDQMILKATSYFTSEELATKYFQTIKELYPRYTRDHMQVILKAVDYFNEVNHFEKKAADKALDFCLSNSLYNGHEFEQVIFVLDDTVPVKTKTIKLMDKNNLEKVNQTPDTSNIEDYENIMNQ